MPLNKDKFEEWYAPQFDAWANQLDGFQDYSLDDKRSMYQQFNAHKRREIMADEGLSPDQRKEIFQAIEDSYETFDPKTTVGAVLKTVGESIAAIPATVVAGTGAVAATVEEAVTGEDIPSSEFRGAAQKAIGAQAEQQFEGAKRLFREVTSGTGDIDADFDRMIDMVLETSDDSFTGKDGEARLRKANTEAIKRIAGFNREDVESYKSDPRKDILSEENSSLLMAYSVTRDPRLKKQIKDNLTLSTAQLDAQERQEEATEAQAGIAKLAIEYGSDPLEAVISAAEIASGFGIASKVGRKAIMGAAGSMMKSGGIEAATELIQLKLTDPNALPQDYEHAARIAFLTGGGMSGVGQASSAMLDRAKRRKENLEKQGQPEVKPEEKVEEPAPEAEPTPEPDVAPVSPLTPEEQKELDELEEISEVGEIKLSDDMQGRLNELRKKEAQPVPEPVQEEVEAEPLTEAEQAEVIDELDEEAGQIEVEPTPEPEGPRPRLPVATQPGTSRNRQGPYCCPSP